MHDFLLLLLYIYASFYIITIKKDTILLRKTCMFVHKNIGTCFYNDIACKMINTMNKLNVTCDIKMTELTKKGLVDFF